MKDLLLEMFYLYILPFIFGFFGSFIVTRIFIKHGDKIIYIKRKLSNIFKRR